MLNKVNDQEFSSFQITTLLDLMERNTHKGTTCWLEKKLSELVLDVFPPDNQQEITEAATASRFATINGPDVVNLILKMVRVEPTR